MGRGLIDHMVGKNNASEASGTQGPKILLSEGTEIRADEGKVRCLITMFTILPTHVLHVGTFFTKYGLQQTNR